MDTLFDLDTCTSAAPKARDNEASALARKIERYATKDTRRTVAAIARWHAASPLHPDHPILGETFVGLWPETEYTVRHIIPRADGDITLQFGHGLADSFEVLEMARLTPDGALVDQLGQWMLPKKLCPPEVKTGGDCELVLTRYHLERAVGRTPHWVLTRSLKRDVLSLQRASEVTALPPQFCRSSNAQLSAEVASALLADRLADLSSEVGALMTVPLTVETIRKIHAFVAHCARGHFRNDAADALEGHFLAEEAAVLQPLFERTHFSFDGNGWSGNATLDTEWCGSDLRVRVHAESAAGASVLRHVAIPASCADQMAIWFSPADRAMAAVKLCGEEAPRRHRLIEAAAPAVSGKRRSQSPEADPFRVKTVQQALSTLLQVLPANDRASIEAGLVTLQQSGLRSDQVENVVRDAHSVAERTVKATLEEIDEVDGIRFWDSSTLVRAVRLARTIPALRAAHVFSYALGVNEFLALTAAATHPREVIEIAPGWFISRGSDASWHGASSSTGFFSGCRSDMTVAFPEAASAIVNEHLCSGQPCTAEAALGAAERAGYIPGDLAAWVRASGRDHDPEALRLVGRRLMGVREVEALAGTLPLVAAAITGSVDKQAAQALLDAIKYDHVADQRWAALAEMARAALTKRYGVAPTVAPKDAQTTMLDGDPEDDVDDREPEDEEFDDDSDE